MTNTMNAIEALTKRVSVPQLTDPAPSAEQERTLLTAALRAPDHAWLRPSRYLTVRGAAREELGRVFLESSDDWQELAADKKNKLLNMPMRAPLIMVAVCRVVEHPKVPREEQLMSTAAGVQNILNAAFALGLGAIWRTGELAENPKVRRALGLLDTDVIVGFVYIGQINGPLKPLPDLDLADFVSDWRTKTS